MPEPRRYAEEAAAVLGLPSTAVRLTVEEDRTVIVEVWDGKAWGPVPAGKQGALDAWAKTI